MQTARQAVRWAIRALGGLLANLALLTLWVDYFGVPEWFAVLPNWVILSTVMYVVNDRWVFAELGSPGSVIGHVRQFIGSESIMVAGKAFNYVLYLGLLPLTDYRIAWTLGAVAAFVVTFAGNRWWWGRRGHSTST